MTFPRTRRATLYGLAFAFIVTLALWQSADSFALSQPSAKAARCATGKTRVHGRCVPIFRSPHRRNLTGLAAWRVVGPWFTNSTFTDCARGFPRCAVEHRYGHTRSGLFYYCRLTPTVGADIINAGFAWQVIGVTLRGYGAWGVTIRAASYSSDLQYYTWSVSNTGVASGLYWQPGTAPGINPATSSTGRMRWVRGGRTCAY